VGNRLNKPTRGNRLATSQVARPLGTGFGDIFRIYIVYTDNDSAVMCWAREVSHDAFAWRDEAAFLGEGDGLRAVGQAELLEDPGDVGLHGRLADVGRGGRQCPLKP
jgi:hypothetical protein